MSWVRKTPPSEQHECAPPMREVKYEVPSRVVGHEGNPRVHREQRPDGVRGDLWRCDHCRKLWRIGLACDVCDRFGDREHPGMHAVGITWRPATLWQQLVHLRHGHRET